MLTATHTHRSNDHATPTQPATRRPRTSQVTRAAIGLSGVALVLSAVTIWHLPAHQYAERPGPVLDLAARITIGNPEMPEGPDRS